MKHREYKLKRNAANRMVMLQCRFPNREFWIAPTQNFKWAVYTRRATILQGYPKNIAVCA